MRTAITLLVPTLSVLALLGCNPPLEENVAPFIEVVSPRVTFADGEERAIGYSGVDLSLELIVRDRDGDASFDVTVFLEGAEIASLQGAAADTLLTIDTGTSLPVGTSTVEIHVDDGRREGLRVRTLSFTPIAADPPQICWDGGTTCTPSIALPDTTQELRGSLLTADTSREYYERFWRDQDGVEQGIQPGTAGTLPADQTAKGDTWSFCVHRWSTTEGGRPLDEEEVPLPPDLEQCTSVAIGNAAPVGPPSVTVEPGRPLPMTPMLCTHPDGTDIDGDALTYTYAWLEGSGAPLSTGMVLDPQFTAPALALRCAVTTLDAESEAPVVESIDTAARPAEQLVGALGLSNPFLYGSDAEAVVVSPAAVVSGETVQHAVGRPGSSTVTITNSERNSNVFLARFVAPNGLLLDDLGIALSSADADADGFDDLLIGSDGSAWYVAGDTVTASSNDQFIDTVARELTIAATGFGQQVVLGDLTNASTLDALVTAGDASTSNRVYVVSGNDLAGTGTFTGNPTTTPSFVATDVGDTFGSVLAVGDLVGDARQDLAVGNPGGVTPTAVYVFRAESVGQEVAAVDSFAKIAADGTRPDLGASLAMADLDGDGVDDLIVGSPSTAEVGVFFGATLGQTLTFADADILLSGPAGSGFGTNVHRFPSVFAGFRDGLVVDAPAANGGLGQIRFFDGALFQASTTTLSDGAATYTVNNQSTAVPLPSLRLAGPPGDVDGDGYPDIVLLETATTGSTRAYFVRSTL
jgi:hypothetical protein